MDIRSSSSGTFEELPNRMGWKHQREHAWSLLEQHANWWEPGSLKPIPGPVARIGVPPFLLGETPTS